ncbi:Conserved membrane protein of uncharacterised function [Mycobacterium tuberculosis]|nr:Conserved membrane protein of uncharacterised function [Mycobacterium tuberculosis]
MVSRYSAYRRGPDVISPDVIDRILVGACAAVWLVFTGVSVAAAVALMDLVGASTRWPETRTPRGCCTP